MPKKSSPRKKAAPKRAKKPAVPTHLKKLLNECDKLEKEKAAVNKKYKDIADKQLAPLRNKIDQIDMMRGELSRKILTQEHALNFLRSIKGWTVGTESFNRGVLMVRVPLAKFPLAKYKYGNPHYLDQRVVTISDTARLVQFNVGWEVRKDQEGKEEVLLTTQIPVTTHATRLLKALKLNDLLKTHKAHHEKNLAEHVSRVKEALDGKCPQV